MAGRPPLFTIEQIELIRRLRNSGISKDHVVQAFEQLERLDRELGWSYAEALANHPLVGSPYLYFPFERNEQSRSPPANDIKQIQAPPTPTENGINNGMNGHDDNSVTSQDMEEFLKKGEEVILEEIRDFVTRYNLKQHIIAEMARLSQPYIGRYLKGDCQSVSDRTKEAIYRWYLSCKKNPQKLKQSPHSAVKRMVSENGELVPFRRERFIFTQTHVQVLEKHFQQEPYPDHVRREEIADECNIAEEKRGRYVPESRRVTVQVVNNWFANKRKEAKKQLRQAAQEDINKSLRINNCYSQHSPPRGDQDLPGQGSETSNHSDDLKKVNGDSSMVNDSSDSQSDNESERAEAYLRHYCRKFGRSPPTMVPISEYYSHHGISSCEQMASPINLSAIKREKNESVCAQLH